MHWSNGVSFLVILGVVLKEEMEFILIRYEFFYVFIKCGLEIELCYGEFTSKLCSGVSKSERRNLADGRKIICCFLVHEFCRIVHCEKSLLSFFRYLLVPNRKVAVLGILNKSRREVGDDIREGETSLKTGRKDVNLRLICR